MVMMMVRRIDDVVMGRPIEELKFINFLESTENILSFKRYNKKINTKWNENIDESINNNNKRPYKNWTEYMTK